MRILLTGSCGYLGSVLTPTLLAAGHKVLALDSLERGGQGLAACCHDPNFEFVRGDCREDQTIARALKGCDAVIPLAGVVGVNACKRDERRAWETNLGAIKTLLRFRSRDQLLLFPMTNSGYGTKTGQAECDEDTPLEPISVYGQSKCQAERAVLDCENTVSLRLATVFGMSPAMRWDLLVNDLTRRAVLDRHLILFEGHYRRNFVHIRDVADCFRFFVEGKQYPGHKRVFNLGNDSANCTKTQLADLVARIVGDVYVHSAEVGIDPDKRDYVVSNQRLREAGFEAKRGLEEGIREVCKGVALL